MRRFLLLWTLLATVLIGTGVIDSVHRVTHASLHRLASSGVARDDGDCHPTAHRCSSHRHREDACGSRAEEGHAGADGTEAAPHSNEHESHDDHECPICVTLASLAVASVALIDDTTPIATLIGRAIVADALVAAPAPLDAIEARPPPAGASIRSRA